MDWRSEVDEIFRDEWIFTLCGPSQPLLPASIDNEIDLTNQKLEKCSPALQTFVKVSARLSGAKTYYFNLAVTLYRDDADASCGNHSSIHARKRDDVC